MDECYRQWVRHFLLMFLSSHLIKVLLLVLTPVYRRDRSVERFSGKKWSTICSHVVSTRITAVPEILHFRGELLLLYLRTGTVNGLEVLTPHASPLTSGRYYSIHDTLSPRFVLKSPEALLFDTQKIVEVRERALYYASLQHSNSNSKYIITKNLAKYKKSFRENIQQKLEFSDISSSNLRKYTQRGRDYYTAVILQHFRVNIVW